MRIRPATPGAGGRAPESGPPKNGQPRTVSLAAETITLLRAHKRHQARIKMANRTTYADHGLVFAKEWSDVRKRGDCLGQPLQINNLGQREYARLIRPPGSDQSSFMGCATRAPLCSSRPGSRFMSSLNAWGTNVRTSRSTCTRTFYPICSRTRPVASTHCCTAAERSPRNGVQSVDNWGPTLQISLRFRVLVRKRGLEPRWPCGH